MAKVTVYSLVGVCRDWTALEVELGELVACVVEELMQPAKNNLIPKAD